MVVTNTREVRPWLKVFMVSLDLRRQPPIQGLETGCVYLLAYPYQPTYHSR
jgi:hypothetical protein